MFNRNKFKAKLVELGITVGYMASEMGINEATLYRKMSGESDFSRNEIQIVKRTLNLSDDDILNIFFAQELA